MQCPTDATVLVMSERSGIEIDYCPTCRGVWLDRGELDKIIERAEPPLAAPAAPPPGAYDQSGGYEQQRDERRQQYDQRYPQPHGKKRKESWLSEIFD
ncbi:MAG: zf-TFIIB domain-containing protein [Nocardioides sp.]